MVAWDSARIWLGMDVRVIKQHVSPPTCELGNGYWAWYNTMINGTGDNLPGPVGPQAFFEKTPGENNPANNFGDGETMDVLGTFCFTISTVASCPPGVDGDNLTVEFQVWCKKWLVGMPQQVYAPKTQFCVQSKALGCPIPQMVGVFPSCASPTSGTVTATPSGRTVPFEIKWSTGDLGGYDNGKSVDR